MFLLGTFIWRSASPTLPHTFNEAVTNSPEGYGGKDTTFRERHYPHMQQRTCLSERIPGSGSEEECRDIIQNGGWQKTTVDTVRDFRPWDIFAKGHSGKDRRKGACRHNRDKRQRPGHKCLLPNEVADELWGRRKGFRWAL